MKKTRSKKSRDTVPLSLTNYKIVKNSKSEPKNLSCLCTFTFENSRDYAQKPLRNRTFMHSASGQAGDIGWWCGCHDKCP
jgi:hypothetical protein